MVISFTSGEETLAYLEINPLNFPELIISDYQLNNHMNWIELLKQIMFILIGGLIADIVYTWFMNASWLRTYRVKKQHGN